LVFSTGVAFVHLLFSIRLPVPVRDRRSAAIQLIAFFDVMVSILSLSFYGYTLIILQVIIVTFAVKLILLLDANEHLIPQKI
jgi:hypothetical protein